MRNFDNIIRQKLEQLGSDAAPNWEALSEQLDGNAFDDLLRPGLDVPPGPRTGNIVPMITGWDALNDKLNIAAEVEGDAFDQLLARRLNSMETSAEPAASWQQLSHRMDTFWTIRRRLVKYRLLEIAAAAALLFTFAPLLRDNPVFTRNQRASVASTTAEQLSNEESQESSIAYSPQEIARIVDGTPLREVSSTSTAATPSALLLRAFDWWNSSATSIEMAPAAASAPQLSVATAEETLSAAPLANRSLKRLPLAATITHAITPAPVAPRKWSVSALAGVQVWDIITPRDETFERPAFSRKRLGATAGLRLAHQLNPRTELSLGFSYSPINYDPEFPTIVQEDAYRVGNRLFDRAESFEGISLNLAQIPLEVRRNLLPKRKRTKLWLHGGVVGTVALNTAYELRTDIVDEARFAPPAPGMDPGQAFGPSQRPVQVNATRVSEAKPFVLGVVEGGLRSTNSFVSARLGLDAEVALSERLDVFGGIEYSQFLPLTEGIGPNFDQLNSLGVSLGARVSL